MTSRIRNTAWVGCFICGPVSGTVWNCVGRPNQIVMGREGGREGEGGLIFVTTATAGSEGLFPQRTRKRQCFLAISFVMKSPDTLFNIPNAPSHIHCSWSISNQSHPPVLLPEATRPDSGRKMMLSDRNQDVRTVQHQTVGV